MYISYSEFVFYADLYATNKQYKSTHQPKCLADPKYESNGHVPFTGGDIVNVTIWVIHCSRILQYYYWIICDRSHGKDETENMGNIIP